MIDYDATLKTFFDETIKFLEKRLQSAKDKEEQTRIVEAVRQVKEISKNPRKYADYNVRVKNNLVLDARAFMPTQYDNSAFRIYQKVEWNMGDLYSPYDYQRHEAQKILLNGIKQMQYKNSTNLLKDLYFLFVSPKKYAVKTDNTR